MADVPLLPVMIPGSDFKYPSHHKFVGPFSIQILICPLLPKPEHNRPRKSLLVQASHEKPVLYVNCDQLQILDLHLHLALESR